MKKRCEGASHQTIHPHTVPGMVGHCRPWHYPIIHTLAIQGAEVKFWYHL